ncbi:hypothetical protein F4810DRAFT_708765 [Camillea tinctor]|nr:hypothetical protein F4810DRAFT_708765 [Camillea tinctor]
MPELTNSGKLLISHLSALPVARTDQSAILPNPPMSFSPSPSLANLWTTSDSNLKRTYWHHPKAYEDNIGKYYIDSVWKRHLDHHRYTHSFQPLLGTERKRYRDIIDRAHKQEVSSISSEEILLYRLSLAVEKIKQLRKEELSRAQRPAEHQVDGPQAPVRRKRGRPRKYPRPEDIQSQAPQPVPAPREKEDSHAIGELNGPARQPDRQPPTSRKYDESEKLIKAGIKELEGFKAFRQPFRHVRQHLDYAPCIVDTNFGRIKAKNELHQDGWFMGHRPGDPIIRIVNAPKWDPLFGPEDAIHNPPPGNEDIDLALFYFRFRNEGIVPFSYSESQQRLEGYAFPAFLTMIIAALAFDPNQPETDAPPELKRISTILMQDMEDMDTNTKDELVRCMSTLQRIWKVKYGTDSSQLPKFLQTQFEKSRSRLGEMAWLVCQVMSMLPGYHILRSFTDWFLQAMVGSNMLSMANWYFDHQLGGEVQEQLQEGKYKNIFFYATQRPLEQTLPVLKDIYDRNGSYKQITKERLEELEKLARSFVPHVFDPTLQIPQEPIHRTSVHISPNELDRILEHPRFRRSNKSFNKSSTKHKRKDGDGDEPDSFDKTIIARSRGDRRDLYKKRIYKETSARTRRLVLFETSEAGKEIRLYIITFRYLFTMFNPTFRTLFTRASLPSSSTTMYSSAIQTSAKKKGKKKKKGKGEERDPRIVNLKSSMPRVVPAPLRFARNRALRHWTIHRAWQLFQNKERQRRNHELERMYQSMHNACEELRKTSGPGFNDEGYLYRVAMEKKGMYGHNNIPIEYSRTQTETPAREPWNHGWTP